MNYPATPRESQPAAGPHSVRDARAQILADLQEANTHLRAILASFDEDDSDLEEVDEGEDQRG